MPRSPRKKRLAASLVAASLLTQVTACGTILHPERRGQPAGRLDAAVVALDAVGLLLFFVPGVIAFAVDFGTGAIYLPPCESAEARPGPAGKDMQTVRLSPAELTPKRLESVVREKTGQTIRLEPGEYRATRLNDADVPSPAALQDGQSKAAPAEVRFPKTGRPE